LQCSEAQYIEKIRDSQPTKKCDMYNRDIPLHVHPDAGRLHTSGKTLSDGNVPLMPNIIPSDTESLIYVVHEDVWRGLTALQRREVLRTRAVLVVHRYPYRHDGQKIEFDEEGFEAFTHLDRLAFVQGE
jgi:hypothetical protein